MITTTYTYHRCPATVTATFTCPQCGKHKRKRTFRHECTVNPFNKNEDGTVRTVSEVLKQSYDLAKRERYEFMKAPLCATCEAALSYIARKDLQTLRKS